jgi:hypothetical protein
MEGDISMLFKQVTAKFQLKVAKQSSEKLYNFFSGQIL